MPVAAPHPSGGELALTHLHGLEQALGALAVPLRVPSPRLTAAGFGVTGAHAPCRFPLRVRAFALIRFGSEPPAPTACPVPAWSAPAGPGTSPAVRGGTYRENRSHEPPDGLREPGGTKMTPYRGRKDVIRDRMEATGESYNVAART